MPRDGRVALARDSRYAQLMGRQLGGRVGCAVMGCVLMGVLSLAVAPGVAQAAPRCVVHGHSVAGVRSSKVVAQTGSMVVYRTHRKHEFEEDQDMWACDRKSNRFTLVGVEELKEGYEEGTLTELHVAGNWLIVEQGSEETSAQECGKYDYEGNQTCTSSESLLIVNAASGLEGRISEAGHPGVLLPNALLSADGAVAWWEEQMKEPGKEAIASLHGCLTATNRHKLVCKPRLVAQGAIPQASVQLVGSTLSWTLAGEQKSSVL
jgi:hypothetical protein